MVYQIDGAAFTEIDMHQIGDAFYTQDVCQNIYLKHPTIVCLCYTTYFHAVVKQIKDLV